MSVSRIQSCERSQVRRNVLATELLGATSQGLNSADIWAVLPRGLSAPSLDDESRLLSAIHLRSESARGDLFFVFFNYIGA